MAAVSLNIDSLMDLKKNAIIQLIVGLPMEISQGPSSISSYKRNFRL